MRPLPIAESSDGPLLRGITTIRGEQTIVIDLSSLSDAPRSEPRRLVSLKTAKRRFALLAEDVLGVGMIDDGTPRLLDGADEGRVQAVRGLDAELRKVVEDIRALPDDAGEGATPV